MLLRLLLQSYLRVPFPCHALQAVAEILSKVLGGVSMSLAVARLGLAWVGCLFLCLPLSHSFRNQLPTVFVLAWPV